MRWFMPSYNGDFRLESAKDDPKKCVLVIEKPTLGEQEQLRKFIAKAVKKKWLRPAGLRVSGPGPGVWTEFFAKLFDTDRREVVLDAPVEKAGKELVRLVKPKHQSLTAVKFRDGKLEVAAGTSSEAFEKLMDKSPGENPATSAVTVKRPTPCCPNCIPGSVERASEVLQEFMSAEQHQDWARTRALVAVGGYSGHRYLIAHRHSKWAQKWGRICRDVDSDIVMHFYDWTVPPEEEVLAAKLVLEHAEHWLRNRATMFGDYQHARANPVFGNPFGDGGDGTETAALLHELGGLTAGLLP